jgi:RNA polymerase sigma-70 factor (ECF subfamily)
MIRTFLATDYPRLVGAVTLIAGSPVVAEDAVQEALARAWQRADRGEEFESLRAWVGTVAVNLCRSGWRRTLVERRARRRVLGPVPVDPADVSPELIDLRRALDALPSRQREAIVLHYYADLSVDEIGRAWNVHPGTVKTTLFRGRRALAAVLGERDVEEEEPDRA